MIIGLFIQAESHAQHLKLVSTYHDLAQKIVKEQYYVLKRNPQILDSMYKANYISGLTKLMGTYKKGKKNGLWQSYYETGTPKWSGNYANDIANGHWQYYYENTLLNSTGLMQDGKKQGTWQSFYENGNLKNEGNYFNGLKEGLWNYYHEDGSKKAKANYHKDIGKYEEYYPNGNIKAQGEIIAGVSDGLWKYYYENNTIKAEGYEKKGIKQGMWKFFHPNGKLMSEGIYNDGVTSGNWKYFHDNGVLSSEGTEQNGQKEGFWKLYYKNGAVKGEANFELGAGKYNEFYENGKLKIDGFIKDEMNEGTWKYYYESGNIEGECNFTKGKGWYKGYYESGNLKMEGQIIDGLKTGVWKLYKEDGSLAGYYTNYQEMLEKGIINPKVIPKDTLKKDSLVIYIPKAKLRKKRSRHFSPKINEFRSLIISGNPLGVFVFRVPVSVEYYFQERLGYELGIQYYREPFFTYTKNIPLQSLFYNGFSLYGRQKFYQQDQDIGMFYYGHELRITNMNYSVKYIDSTKLGNELIKQPTIEQYMLEYSIMVGNRVMSDAKKKGITADIFLGIGLGYRFNIPSWNNDNEAYEELFKTTPQSSINVPIRFGIMIGYALGKKR